jgi:hypothetical protein
LAQAPLVHFLATFDSSCWTNLEPTESLGAGNEGMPEWLDRHRRFVPETGFNLDKLVMFFYF